MLFFIDAVALYRWRRFQSENEPRKQKLLFLECRENERVDIQNVKQDCDTNKNDNKKSSSCSRVDQQSVNTHNTEETILP